MNIPSDIERESAARSPCKRYLVIEIPMRPDDDAADTFNRIGWDEVDLEHDGTLWESGLASLTIIGHARIEER